jgi:cell division protein FtsB
MVRDVRTKALLSTDKDAVRAYEKRRQELKTQKERINRLEQELADLKTIIAELIEKR